MEWKKIPAMFMMALLVISLVPLAFAENSDSQDESTNSVIDNNINTRFESRTRVRFDSDNDVRENILEIRSRIKETRSTLRHTRADLNEVKDVYNNARERWLEVQNDLNVEARLEIAQNFGMAMVERIIVHIDEHIEKIEESDLTNKEELIARLENRKDTFENYLDEIENSESMDELRMILREMKEDWKDTETNLKTSSNTRIEVAASVLLQKYDNLANRVDIKLEAMSEEGIDVSYIESDLDNLNTLIAETKLTLEAFKDEPSRELFDELKVDLKEINSKLRAIVKDIKDESKEYRQVEDNSLNGEIRVDNSNRLGINSGKRLDKLEEDVLDSIRDAEQEIEKTRDRIERQKNRGFDVSDSEEVLLEAEINIKAAITLYEQLEYKKSEELAEISENLAKRSRNLLSDDDSEEDLDDDSKKDISDSDDNSNDEDDDDDNTIETEIESEIEVDLR